MPTNDLDNKVHKLLWGNEGWPVLAYSTNILDTWLAIERMHQFGWSMSLFDSRRYDPPEWDADFSHPDLQGSSDDTEASGETAQIAICKSIVLALELSPIYT